MTLVMGKDGIRVGWERKPQKDKGNDILDWRKRDRAGAYMCVRSAMAIKLKKEPNDEQGCYRAPVVMPHLVR